MAEAVSMTPRLVEARPSFETGHSLEDRLKALHMGRYSVSGNVDASEGVMAIVYSAGLRRLPEIRTTIDELATILKKSRVDDETVLAFAGGIYSLIDQAMGFNDDGIPEEPGDGELFPGPLEPDDSRVLGFGRNGNDNNSITGEQ